jgi:hypothetical protein
MNFAVNYSHEAAELLRAGQIEIDYFKCAAWQEMIAAAQELCPVYVHFPLVVGQGNGDAIDSETNQVADWRKIEKLLTQTKTPFVNVHLAPKTKDYPNIPADTSDPEHVEMVRASDSRCSLCSRTVWSGTGHRRK